MDYKFGGQRQYEVPSISDPFHIDGDKIYNIHPWEIINTTIQYPIHILLWSFMICQLILLTIKTLLSLIFILCRSISDKIQIHSLYCYGTFNDLLSDFSHLKYHILLSMIPIIYRSMTDQIYVHSILELNALLSDITEIILPSLNY